MIASLFSSKDIECPGCGAQGMTIKPHGSETTYLLDDRFRREVRNGALDIVCMKCDAPAVPVLQSGYN